MNVLENSEAVSTGDALSVSMGDAFDDTENSEVSAEIVKELVQSNTLLSDQLGTISTTVTALLFVVLFQWADARIKNAVRKVVRKNE